MAKRGFILALLMTLFGATLCTSERDLRIDREVDDFQKFLRGKTEHDSHTGGPEDDSQEYSDEQIVPGFDNVREDSKSIFHSGGEDLHGEDSGNFDEELPRTEQVERRHPVEEILFIRRSDSEVNDPIAEVVEKLVGNHPPEDQVVNLHDVVSEADEPVSLIEATTEDACPTENFTPDLHQVCMEGPQYEMRLPQNYSERLRQEMQDILQGEVRQYSKCNYRKRLGPEKGVEDRSLCPFEWTISNRNASRIPEFLYEARCSCQLSRKMRRKRFKCVELKRVIPVLWMVNCSGGKRKYKQGWKKISVACVPLEERESKVVDFDPMF